jgi:hypothetical protein
MRNKPASAGSGTAVRTGMDASFMLLERNAA